VRQVRVDYPFARAAYDAVGGLLSRLLYAGLVFLRIFLERRVRLLGRPSGGRGRGFPLLLAIRAARPACASLRLGACFDVLRLPLCGGRLAFNCRLCGLPRLAVYNDGRFMRALSKIFVEILKAVFLRKFFKDDVKFVFLKCRHMFFFFPGIFFYSINYFFIWDVQVPGNVVHPVFYHHN
jgi:hypothetical protein